MSGQSEARMVVVADFHPPNAMEKFEQWRRVSGVELLDDWQIDAGRAVGGDFVRVMAPADSRSGNDS